MHKSGMLPGEGWKCEHETCKTAAIHKKTLAIGLMTHIQILELDAACKKILEQDRIEFEHQVSAVAIIESAATTEVCWASVSHLSALVMTLQ